MNTIIVSKELEKLLLDNPTDVGTALLTAPVKNINYIGVSQDVKGQVSYLTKARLEREEVWQNPWDSTLRYRSRPAKLARKVLGDDMTTDQYQEFAGAFRALMVLNTCDTNGIDIVSGDEIARLYHYSMYSRGGGNLGSSCMRHSSCKDYFGIYTDNPEVVSMAVMLDEGGYVLGRSIIWTEGNTQYYDRVYGADDVAISSIAKFCEEHGMIDLYNDEPELSITLQNGWHEHWPYMDSMKHIQFISNSRCILSNHVEGDHILESVDGFADENEGASCYDCGCRVDDEYCHVTDDGMNYCDECGCYSDWDDRSYRRVDCIWCDVVESYVHDSDILQGVDGNGNACGIPDGMDGLVVLPDGRLTLYEFCTNTDGSGWVLDCEVSSCESCGSSFHEDDLNDNSECEDCSAKEEDES